MTLSLGNKVRKVQDDGTTPVPNEGHVLFEVIGTGSVQSKEPGADGKPVYVSNAFAILKALE